MFMIRIWPSQGQEELQNQLSIIGTPQTGGEHMRMDVRLGECNWMCNLMMCTCLVNGSPILIWIVILVVLIPGFCLLFLLYMRNVEIMKITQNLPALVNLRLIPCINTGKELLMFMIVCFASRDCCHNLRIQSGASLGPSPMVGTRESGYVTTAHATYLYKMT